ncbi:class II aldolase/adducin family protein [Pseudomonas sp. BN411]|uniref:class II aldolase/adducin family protein n=1 Tax=Pseudomonas sp. BN411 TaxID=2567887 RepID=UPI002457A12D|nr:class II aldolase/adducin family protein [Pseudomonas sp. BN411]MDH4562376.1 aldolase [Pseudomonas sp. BN411]
MNLPDEFSPQEWSVRCDLAALFRLLAYYRMTDLVDSHASACIPGEPGCFLINKYGVPFERMRASDLVKVDLDGVPVDQGKTDGPMNIAGAVIHSSIHRARPDMKCVIHTHTAAGIAVSTLEEGLLPLSQHAMKFYGQLKYHTYGSFIDTRFEEKAMIESLGDANAMLLHNHGIIVGGRTIGEAFHSVYMLERACQIHLQIRSTDQSVVIPDPEMCQKTYETFSADFECGIVELAWQGALQIVSSQKDSYCR